MSDLLGEKTTKKGTGIVKKKKGKAGKGVTTHFKIPEISDKIKRDIDSYCTHNKMSVETFFNEAIDRQLKFKKEAADRIRFL